MAGMAMVLPHLVESDKGLWSKGCLALGQLEFVDIPFTGTHCRMISSANGQNQTRKKFGISLVFF